MSRGFGARERWVRSTADDTYFDGGSELVAFDFIGILLENAERRLYQRIIGLDFGFLVFRYLEGKDGREGGESGG